MIEDIHSYFLYFLAAWLTALIALLFGAYAGPGAPHIKGGIVPNLLIYLQVWVIVALSKLAFGYFGYLMQWRPTIQAIYPEFAFPLLLGAYLARILLRIQAQKTALKRTVQP